MKNKKGSKTWRREQDKAFELEMAKKAAKKEKKKAEKSS
jgi:hypothetical protein